ncbi:MAG: zf-HC2 domain-containing protein [Opitutaceae bacterium]|jgi:hypothetical protein|nr:zf-HC2 domain-containing protein [Opitutaceae bacterium]
MNETRFKELLNLYLDHRLSPEEARELERALAEQPSLRRRLRSYEIMHRGCAELFRRSEQDAPAPDVLVEALRRAEQRMVLKSERRATLQGWLTWGTAAGAAAVVALLVAKVSQPGVSTPTVAATGGAMQLASSSSAANRTAISADSQPLEVRRLRADAMAVRNGLPEHLTLAALGIAPESQVATTSLANWSAEAESQTRASAAQTETASWMQDARRQYMPTSAAATGSFSTRPLSGWGQSGSGFQVQTAGYTFER